MSIEIRNVSYVYMKGTPFERLALRNVNVMVEEGSVTAIAGHTGSGKSTLVQIIAGLLHPTEGQLLVDGVDLGEHSRKGKQVAKEAGLIIFCGAILAILVSFLDGGLQYLMGLLL